MSKLRVALIGNGGICRGCHVENYYEDERVEVVAFCDIIEERAIDLRDKYYPNAAVYTDYKELLKDDSIDAVDICTPNYLHSIIAVDAFKAGKHVLCEKPDAIDVTEVLKMKNAADEAGKVLMVIRNNRFATASQYAKKFIEDGKMGEIYCGRCGWQRRRGIPGKGGWFTTKAQSGGGPLIDLGVHVIDLVKYLIGNPKPVSVYGATFKKLGNRPGIKSKVGYASATTELENVCDVEDLATALIRFDNGAVLSVEASFSLNIKNGEGNIQFFGTKAGAKLDPQVEVFTDENGYLVDMSFNQDTGLSFDGLFCREMDHFVDCVLNGTECISPAEDGVEIMKILDAVYESARTGHEVVIG